MPPASSRGPRSDAPSTRQIIVQPPAIFKSSHLVRGTIRPEAFFGGTMHLDSDKAHSVPGFVAVVGRAGRASLRCFCALM